MWLHELGEAPFTHEERRFLSRAGRALVQVATLVELVEAEVGPDRPARGRPKYLATRLLARGLFTTYDEAFAFATSYYTLAKQGPLSLRLLWDWE
jgi:hypothetical protein